MTQPVIVSGLYLVFAFVSTYLAVGYGMRGLSYARLVAEINPGIEVYPTDVVPIAMAIVLLSGMGASLKSMWDVRHSKAE